MMELCSVSLCTMEPLPITEVPSVVIELPGVLLASDDDDEDTDDEGLPRLFVNLNGTSSVKCSNCGR